MQSSLPKGGALKRYNHIFLRESHSNEFLTRKILVGHKGKFFLQRLKYLEHGKRDTVESPPVETWWCVTEQGLEYCDKTPELSFFHGQEVGIGDLQRSLPPSMFL